MVNFPKLDLTRYDGYVAKSIGRADDNLIRAVYKPFSFPYLDPLQSLNRLMTFEEILASTVDEDEDNQKVRDEELKSTLEPLYLGLVLAGQPLGFVEDITS